MTEQKEKKKMGRPSSYTDEMADEICNTIAVNPIGIKRLAKLNPHWPNPDTIYEWLKKHPYFADSYARAKRNQITPIIEEILEIADDTTNDSCFNKNGELIPNSEWINRSRLRIDTRKWLAAKLVPRVYGDRIQVDNGNDETLKEINRVKSLVENLKAKHE